AEARDGALKAHIEGGLIADIPVAQLSTEEARDKAYDALVDRGLAAPRISTADMDASLAKTRFFNVYDEPSQAVTDAAAAALA
ncbi:MAG: urea ABC transporter permease subunit UrtB, partial [Lentibacter algarum]